VVNKGTAHLVPRHLCIVAAATFPSMKSSHLRPRIWTTISWSNRMIMLSRRAPIPDASWWRRQASKSSKECFKGALSGSSDTLKCSKTVLLVSSPITIRALLLMMMWLSYVTMITLSILPLWALWPLGSIHPVSQLQITCCRDGMHWVDACSRIRVVGGYFLAL